MIAKIGIHAKTESLADVVVERAPGFKLVPDVTIWND